MIGITSYGAYIPRLRLDRMSIVESMGWFAPAIMMVAQGERSFGNWDEDSLTMAVASARDCLQGYDKSLIDAVYLCSTTLPFTDRLNSGILKTALNLVDQIHSMDITASTRCGTMGIIEAMATVKSGEKSNALVCATDMRLTKAAYFYEMWFGDGSASVTIGTENVIAEFLGSHTVTCDFVDHFRGANHSYDYMWEERWVRDEGYSKLIPEAVTGLLDKLDMTMAQVDHLSFPCFFKSEHKKIAHKLGAAPEKVIDNLHEVCGETGAAHSLMLFLKALEKSKPGEKILMAGFGQGCDALLFEVSSEIKNLSKRDGVSGALANGYSTKNYSKYLKFRELIDTEMGIRAEAPTQTAMTVLWRKRQMLFGMVGGICSQCNTPQFPKADICIHPECRAVDTQAPYEFANEPAHIMSYTGDLLAVSVNPPAIYGMVVFENGGRFMADFTDCEMAGLSIGQSVRLDFRKRYTDKERGFTGYFWKAIPIPGSSPDSSGNAEYGADIRFDGQVAVITGAGAGLGRSYALELAQRGAKVLVNDLGGSTDGSGSSNFAADRVVKEIIQNGGEAVANYDSVATYEGGKAIIAKAMEAWGRIDILINNAGVLRDKSLHKMTADMWKTVIDVHLNGAYYVTQPAFKIMRENGFGRIIFTTSAAGLYGNFGQTNYASAKMGLVGLMNTLKLEGERYGIKINTIAPIAGTRLTQSVLPPDLFDRLKPESVTPLVIYLSSGKCNETGMIFNAGGGYINRVAVVTGPGTVLGDGVEPPSIEDIHRNFAKIDDMSSIGEYSDATSALSPMLEAFEAPKKEEVVTEDKSTVDLR